MLFIMSATGMWCMRKCVNSSIIIKAEALASAFVFSRNHYMFCFLNFFDFLGLP